MKMKYCVGENIKNKLEVIFTSDTNGFCFFITSYKHDYI